ncbi:hypothetical protein HHK36_026216 [Tetracentron sinense]|uniref:C3H1-type domain-containing protein n=1 Tax=Tetracentron sinense TaxID=13715 RepID=A0A835D498_TETSI|nr:hypothetical protein HHK36_026216 [Tetracentron sinense]
MPPRIHLVENQITSPVNKPDHAPSASCCHSLIEQASTLLSVESARISFSMDGPTTSAFHMATKGKSEINYNYSHSTMETATSSFRPNPISPKSPFTGDFNNVLDVGEKLGGQIREAFQIKPFAEMVLKAMLMDLGFQGPQFTWNNKREGGDFIQCRLDRGFANTEWRTLFQDVHVLHLDDVGSDHNPILINLEKQPPKNRRFRFEAMWTLHEGSLSDIHASLSKDHNKDLIRPFLAEEVEIACFQMGPTKAPGPDGMPALFYQHNWETVGPHLCNAVLSFLNEGSIFAPMNATFISLIPKIGKPERVYQFRPINLYNVCYKIAAKVLANRLKVVLHSLINHAQSAFILGVEDDLVESLMDVHSGSSVSKLFEGYSQEIESQAVLKLPFRTQGAPDQLIWHYHKTGIFTVKSAYHVVNLSSQAHSDSPGSSEPIVSQVVATYVDACCQYGERCKFLHVTQQQPKPNVFGFGTQTGLQYTNQQQQGSNGFGFGVQNSSQPKGASGFGPKQQNQSKPFENKWTRFSPIASAANSTSRQPDSQPQVANHKCTDPESCKRQIIEDFEHERPLWKLTCYGHCKNRPCDIVGDISYEELRAAAYDDAKLGLSLHSIVEKERNLLNSKLIEFESLLRNPYVIPSDSTPAGSSPFPGINPTASLVTPQNSVPPSVSSFSQLGASITPGFNNRQDTFLKLSFCYLGSSPSAPTTNSFGQSSFSQISSGLGMNNLTFGNGGSFGNQQPMQPFVRASTSSIPNFSNSVMSAGSNPYSISSAGSTQFPSSRSNQSPIPFNGPDLDANIVGQSTLDGHSVDNKKMTVAAGDASIWLKDEWNPGEVKGLWSATSKLNALVDYGLLALGFQRSCGCRHPAYIFQKKHPQMDLFDSVTAG